MVNFTRSFYLKNQKVSIRNRSAVVAAKKLDTVSKGRSETEIRLETRRNEAEKKEIEKSETERRIVAERILREKGRSNALGQENTYSFGDVPTFDPNAPELNLSWSTYASTILCLNTYPNGITLSVHSNYHHASNKPSNNSDSRYTESKELEAAKLDLSKFHPQQFHLRFRDTRDYHLPVGKYFLYKEACLTALEQHLSHLRKTGQLTTTALYFGTTTDPFSSLHKKFDLTMGIIELLEKYTPGMTIFQTRSPLIISVLPVLKYLGEKSVAVFPIETISEKAIQRYTPGKSKIGERLVAADGLRKQGITVNLQVSPILPYGDPERDSWDFAEILERHSDYITFGCLATGLEHDEKYLKNTPIAQRLVGDREYYFLRPYSYQHVYRAVKALSPEKLVLPVKRPQSPSQLKLFAA